MVGSLRWSWRRTETLWVAKASWVTGEKLRKRWRTGARTAGWTAAWLLLDLSKARSWEASRAVHSRGGEAAMVNALQCELKKIIT